MSKSSSSKSDSYASYPESITERPSQSISQNVTKLIKNQSGQIPIHFIPCI